MHRNHRSVPLALLTAAAVLAMPALARAVTYACTEAGVAAAIAAGGAATFSCTAPTTVVLSTARTITVSGTDLDGGGRLILSGGDARVPLTVAAGVTATVRNMVLEHGSSSGYGGCLAVSGSLTLSDSTVRNCRAAIGGNGVLVAGGGQLRMDRCTVSGNSGGVEGALHVNGTATVADSTISDNALRGVMARFGGSVTLNNCTVVAGGNEPLFVVAPGDTATLSHTMLVGTGPTVGGSGALVSQGYNLFSSAPGIPVTGSITGNQIAVPVLGLLADNGGPTQTRALLACSPGINAGATSGGPAIDQRGQPRLVNGARDIGAYESTLFPCVTIDDVTHVEGNSGMTAFGFTARLSGASTIAMQVDVASADGTATLADGDYSALTSTLNFPAGTTSVPVTLQVIGDTRFESDETVLLNLRNPNAVAIADAQGVATITNDDAQPTVSVADATVVEGNSGTRTLTFNVSLSQVSSQSITVAYATSDVTATVADNDYVARSGTLTFAPGVRTLPVAVTVNGDVQYEPDEVLALQLSAPTNATLGTARASGTIANDDGVPTVSIDSVSVTEGMSGVTNAVFTVTLSNPSGLSASVAYATADGTATAGNDYTATSGRLTFPPGVSSQTISVPVTGDTTYEPDETFSVALSAPTGVTIAGGTGTGTITNDDPLPTLDIADARVTEGNTGTTSLTFDVTLGNPSATPVMVSFTTADDTATVADGDYDPASGVLTFAPGITRQSVTVTVHGDVRFESDEALNLTVFAPAGAVLGRASAVGTIANDDGAPSLSIADVSVAEGNVGTTDAVFTLSLDAPSALPVTVHYATADGSAMAGSDYTMASGDLTFAPGITSQTVTVAVAGDTIYEGDETFRVDLTTPSGATLADGTGIGTITDDEARPGLAIGSAMIAEGNAGRMSLALTVTLSGASEHVVSVDWTTADGTATTVDSDYVADMGTLTFAPDATSQTVRVEVVGDTRVEADESFVVRLSNAMGATIATPEGTVTITNDDTEIPPVDAGVDASVDASADAGTDAGREASVDAGREASVDASVDARMEASVDASADAAVDAGADGGPTGTTPSGCGCTVVGGSAPGSTPWGPTALLALGLAIAARRRRRR